MKITNPDVIKNGEKDLIKAVQEDLDLDAVKTILLEKMSAAALRSNGGKIIVHDNEIAFQLDFDIQLNGSLLFDRQGNHIPENEDLEPSIPEDLDLDGVPIADDLEQDEPLPLSDEFEQEEIEADDIIQDGLADEDITDILKESQDFWDQKKETP